MADNLTNKRIIVNKYTDTTSAITKDSFYSGHGEFIVSIEPGKEGIFIKNANDDLVEIGIGGSDSFIHQDLTESQYEELITSGTTIVDGREIKYNPNIYYMIYEDEVE